MNYQHMYHLSALTRQYTSPYLRSVGFKEYGFGQMCIFKVQFETRSSLLWRRISMDNYSQLLTNCFPLHV